MKRRPCTHSIPIAVFLLPSNAPISLFHSRPCVSFSWAPHIESSRVTRSLFDCRGEANLGGCLCVYEPYFCRQSQRDSSLCGENINSMVAGMILRVAVEIDEIESLLGPPRSSHNIERWSKNKLPYTINQLLV